MAQSNGDELARMTPHQPWRFRQISDTAANDSNKTLTVPAGKVWEVITVYASLATSADAGNRQLQLVVGDGTNEIGRSDAADVQAASSTEYYHWDTLYTAAAADGPVATEHFAPLPLNWLPPGYTIQILDTAAIAATADDLTIRVLVREYDVSV